MLQRNYALIFVCALLLGCIGWIIVREARISKLEFQNQGYDVLIEQLEGELAAKEKELHSLEAESEELKKELKNIPTDVQVIEKNPVLILDTNSSWGAIKSSIDAAIVDTVIIK